MTTSEAIATEITVQLGEEEVPVPVPQDLLALSPEAKLAYINEKFHERFTDYVNSSSVTLWSRRKKIMIFVGIIGICFSLSVLLRTLFGGLSW